VIEHFRTAPATFVRSGADRIAQVMKLGGEAAGALEVPLLMRWKGRS
jgi:hypothetical protein